MNRALPVSSAELLNGHSDAQQIAEACAVAYWMHGRDNSTSLFHLNKIHAHFAALANALGYDISERMDGSLIAEMQEETK